MREKGVVQPCDWSKDGRIVSGGQDYLRPTTRNRPRHIIRDPGKQTYGSAEGCRH